MAGFELREVALDCCGALEGWCDVLPDGRFVRGRDHLRACWAVARREVEAGAAMHEMESLHFSAALSLHCLWGDASCGPHADTEPASPATESSGSELR
mmetsp:Transcript_13386/g.35720  ORF Transcript_13386/g.35720 Transcript_13386/m.35720 type:complete len:98 (-) Transcript_13386:2000-2293(-)